MSSSTTNDHQQGNSCRISCDFEILRQTPVFAGAPTEVVRLFAYLARHKIYRPGDEIITQGTRADCSFFLIRGHVEISTLHRGKEITVQILPEGTFFGELALLARFKWFFTARAVDEAELIIIDRESFQKVLDKYPEKRDKVTEKIIQLRIARLEEQTTYMLDRVVAAGLESTTNGKTSIL